MRVQVTQENLNKALSAVSKVATSRGTLPILSHVLIKTVSNRLSIAATNLDIAITHTMGAKVIEEGSVTIPARLLQDFIANLPSGVIDITTTDNKIHIQSGSYESTINGSSSEDFPVMPSLDEATPWSIASDVLRDGLQQVVVAASHDEARPILTGVYVYTNDGFLYLVATDSYRLAEKKLKKLETEVSLLIPVTSMQELLRIMGDDQGEVEVTHDEQQVVFTVGETQLVTRLIDGNYPDYKKLIPTSFSTQTTVSKQELQNITKVASLFARESAGSVTIRASEQDGTLSIRSVASQLGENTSAANAKVTGEGAITLNARYILDALHILPGAELFFGFNGKLEPTVLKDSAQDDYVHIIMPLKS